LRLVNHITQLSDDWGGPDAEYSALVGAVYLFSRTPGVTNADGTMSSLPYWRTVETGKVYAPDGFARDRFGGDIALSGYTAAIGAAGVDGGGKNAGAAYLLDTEFQRVSFFQNEYVALEGTDSRVTITIVRDSDYTDTVLTIGYSTSDLTATGVDSDKVTYCETLAAARRDGCGDYQQTAGEVTFAKGSASATFTVNIMNDFCYERYMEYVQLTLNVPGGGPISGEGYMATIRIDDNDWETHASTLICQGGIF
jgi:hypothetical protein